MSVAVRSCPQLSVATFGGDRPNLVTHGCLETERNGSLTPARVWQCQDACLATSKVTSKKPRRGCLFIASAHPRLPQTPYANGASCADAGKGNQVPPLP